MAKVYEDIMARHFGETGRYISPGSLNLDRRPELVAELRESWPPEWQAMCEDVLAYARCSARLSGSDCAPEGEAADLVGAVRAGRMEERLRGTEVPPCPY
jgi:hypothetical protein